MEARETCNIGLTLGLGTDEFAPRRKENKRPIQFLQLFAPCSKEEVGDEEHHFGLVGEKKNGKYIEYKNDCNSDDQSNNTISNNNDENDNGPRKKLRLTKEQATLLEDSFKEHTTLNSAQKEYLANRLNLKPRQVEVWFQNRRARTKVKQTEVDYEFLKECCESLREENRRLRTELQELISSKPGSSPFYVRYAKAATLTMCSSCNKIGKISEETNTTVIDMVGKPEKLYGGFDESALTEIADSDRQGRNSVKFYGGFDESALTC